MGYDRLGRDVRDAAVVLLILVLASATVWFASQASQHQADYVRAAHAVDSLSAQAHAASSSLEKAMTRIAVQTKTLKACRAVLGKLAASAKQASQASVVGAKGVAGKLAAIELLGHAIARFKAASAQLAACRR